jgi:hypothetical protein
MSTNRANWRHQHLGLTMSLPCRDISTGAVCFLSSAGVRQTLVAHYEYRAFALGNTVIHAVRYTDAAGLPVDTSSGTVTVGACAVASPDVEWAKLCDVAATGVVTEFYQQIVTSFTSSGAPVVPNVVTTYAIDKITPYAPSGTVSDCVAGCDAVPPVGVVSTWG